MNTVIIYPYTHPSPKWLKLAALCWDDVYRLKPTRVKDPQHIRDLDRRLGGVLRVVDPRKVVRKNPHLLENFLDWTARRKRDLRRGGSQGAYHHVPFYAWKMPKVVWDGLLNSGFARGDRKRQRVTKWKALDNYCRFSNSKQEIRKYKLSREEKRASEEIFRLENEAHEHKWSRRHAKAKKLLAEAERIRQKHLVTCELYQMPPLLRSDIADHYISMIAAFAARDKKRDLLASSGLFTDSALFDRDQLRSKIATATVRAYLPRNLQDIDPRKIRALRSRLAEKRIEYHMAIQELVTDISSVSSEGELVKLQKQAVGLAKERVEAVRFSYRKHRLDTCLKTLTLSLSPVAVASTIGTLLGTGIFVPAAVGAAIAAFSARTLLDWQSRRYYTPERWSFALDVRKGLS